MHLRRPCRSHTCIAFLTFPLQLPWVPLLSEEERLRGMSYYGGGARLRAVAAKLAAGQHIKAVTLGGSVTYGHGVDDLRLSYPALLFSFINASWPHRRAAVGGLGHAVWAALCGAAAAGAATAALARFHSHTHAHAQGSRAAEPWHAREHRSRHHALRRRAAGPAAGVTWPGGQQAAAQHRHIAPPYDARPGGC